MNQAVQLRLSWRDKERGNISLKIIKKTHEVRRHNSVAVTCLYGLSFQSIHQWLHFRFNSFSTVCGLLPTLFAFMFQHPPPFNPQPLPPPARNNALGLDLNRNFPDYFKTNNKKTQVETEAVKQWLNNIQFVLSAQLHGGALVASYPFDNTPNSNGEWEGELGEGEGGGGGCSTHDAVATGAEP